MLAIQIPVVFFAWHMFKQWKNTRAQSVVDYQALVSIANRMLDSQEKFNPALESITSISEQAVRLVEEMELVNNMTTQLSEEHLKQDQMLDKIRDAVSEQVSVEHADQNAKLEVIVNNLEVIIAKLDRS